MGGEPYTWRRVRTVRRQAVGNLPPSLRVTPKKLFEDMDKYIEATKDLKLVL